jgi:hypothetical protein
VTRAFSCDRGVLDMVAVDLEPGDILVLLIVSSKGF